MVETETPNEQSFSQQSTAQLLRKQADLIRSSEPKPKQKIFFPPSKTFEQIKQENYDLRHKKSFMRVLQMHSVMPPMLRKVTEPPKVFAKDYSIDVDQVVQKTKEEYKQSFLAASSHATLSRPGQQLTSITATTERTECDSSMQGLRQKSQMTPGSKAGPGEGEEQDTKAALQSKSGLPIGATVEIDAFATKQIKEIEQGQDPSLTTFKDRIRQGILHLIDQAAIEEVQNNRRRLSLLKFSRDEKAKSEARISFMSAANTQSATHQLAMNCPKDNIYVLRRANQKSSRPKTVGHQHLIKLPFDRLPPKLQQNLIDKKLQEHPSFGKSTLSQSVRKSKVRGSSQQSLQGGTIDGGDTSTAAQTLAPTSALLKPHRPSTVTCKFDTKLRMQAPRKATENLRLQHNRKSSILKNISTRKRSIQFGTTADYQYQSDLLGGQESEMAELSMKGTTSMKITPNGNLLPTKKKTGAMGTASMVKTSSHSISLNKKLHRKNDSLFRVQQQSNQYHQFRGKRKTIDHSTVSNGGGPNISIYSISENPYANLTTMQKKESSVESLRVTSEGQPCSSSHRGSRSVSNLPEERYDIFSKEFSNKQTKARTGARPLYREIAKEDQVPVQIGDDCFVVKQDFHYQKPKNYKITFAKPAIFINGCLTCGNENAKVEHYGERYCCSTCQKSLATPTGETVTLRTSHCGRFIVAQAWKYSKLLKGIKVNIDDLRIRGGHKCHATFAGERGDIIVLIDEIDESCIYK